ncbi:myo-inositol transporter [Bacillus tequilensis]|nr:myo-inositol transporter [Bacillus tequilensis]
MLMTGLIGTAAILWLIGMFSFLLEGSLALPYVVLGGEPCSQFHFPDIAGRSVFYLRCIKYLLNPVCEDIFAGNEKNFA